MKLRFKRTRQGNWDLKDLSIYLASSLNTHIESTKMSRGGGINSLLKDEDDVAMTYFNYVYEQYTGKLLLSHNPTVPIQQIAFYKKQSNTHTILGVIEQIKKTIKEEQQHGSSKENNRNRYSEEKNRSAEKERARSRAGSSSDPFGQRAWSTSESSYKPGKGGN